MKFPSPISISSEEHPFSAGGFAPWPNAPQAAPATARTNLLVCFVASVLFAASVVMLTAVVFGGIGRAEVASVSGIGAAESFSASCVTSGVRKMVYGNAARARVSEEPKLERTGPALKFISADDPAHLTNVRKALLAGADLSEGQMFAMMNASTDHRQQAIWFHARQNIFELPPFTLSTFRELSERGIVEKPEGSKYHRLSTTCGELANAVADELVRRHKIHASILVHTRERTSTVTLRCTCSWSCSLVAGRNMQLKASRAFASHLRSINAVDRLAEGIAIATRRKGATEG